MEILRLGRARFELGLQRLGHVGVAAGDGQVVDDGAVVQPGAAHQEGVPPGGRHRGEGVPGRRLELRDRELLVRVDQVEQVVRYRRPCGGVGLGGADVHAAVHAHGVDRDDVAVTPSPGQLQRGAGLARRRRPDQGDGRHPLADGDAPAVARTRHDFVEPTREVVRMARDDGDAGQCSWFGTVGVAREVDELALAGAPGQHGRVAAAHPFDERLFAAADPGLVAGQGRAVDHRLETLEALGHDVGRHELRLHVRGAGAGARREDECERAVVRRLGADRERLLKVVLGLAGEPDDDVGRHRQVVHGGPGRVEPFEVTSRRVTAAHGAQHAVAARLEREVQLLAHLGRFGHGRDRLGPQVLGVGAGEAHAPDPFDATDGAQQVGEERAAPRQVAPVGVDVLPEQGDLAVPGAGQTLDLGHDVVHRSAHLGPAHRGHDAERAGIVATGLDRDPGRVGQLAHRGEWARRLVGRGRVEDLGHGPVGAGLPEQRRGAGQVVRPEHDVDPAHPLLNQVAVLLGQAPAHGDLQVRFGVDQLLEAAQRAVEPPVGILPDAARVEHDDVGLLHAGRRRQAVRDEQPGQPFGVVLVHLAPEGADEVGPRHPGKSTEPARGPRCAPDPDQRRPVSTSVTGRRRRRRRR